MKQEKLTFIRNSLQGLREDLSAPGFCNGLPRGAIGAYYSNGEIAYSYPEIAGYWLRWASKRSDVAEGTGYAVIEWLSSIGNATTGWPTRIYVKPGLQSGQRDSAYSNAQYLFDHAMLWDGVTRWAKGHHCPKAMQLVEKICSYLQNFTSHTLNQGWKVIIGKGALPLRWSGRFGPFLLKVYARLKERDSPLNKAFETMLPILLEQAINTPHNEAHPQLYAIEGLIELGYNDLACTLLHQLINAHGGLTGLRESIHQQGVRRLDVLAQTLRAMCLLDVKFSTVKEKQLLAYELCEHIDQKYRLPFACSADLRPTWVSLFSEQALTGWLGENLLPGDIV